MRCVGNDHIVKQIAHCFEVQKYVFKSLQIALVKFYNYRQSVQQTVSQNLGDSAAKAVPHTSSALTTAECTAKARDHTLAFAFLSGSDPKRVAGLLVDIKN